MIELVRFPHAQMARLFAEVLRERGIHVEQRQQGAEVALLLTDPERFQEARDLLEAFRSNPLDPSFQGAAWRSGAVFNLRRSSSGPGFWAQWWAGMGPVVKVVLLASVLVFLSPMLVSDQLYRALLFAPDLAAISDQPWRLFTPMLLHFSALHIIFNLLWWQSLGNTIERFQSSFQLLWITLLVAAVSNLAQFYATGPKFGGLSGVVFGLLGYLWLYGRINPSAGYGIPRAVVIFMLAWLVICWVGLTDIVANEAHFAGLLSGCLLGAVTGLWRRMLQA
ncbi:MAG: rhomboid family intramembrane serine protease [Gammaproteobacteria bacterium HGW-Gammaproteobacteria-14]|nr:MAG: rhomboid family intramembrane serine protease [Gammaproteobacteria bacterium HGW-Gammaproteobacteria-14]